MDKKRCFLAINVPAYQKTYQRILDLSNDLQLKINPVKPSLYHFTVHFFGDITPNRIQEISNTMQQIQFEPFDIELANTGIIPPNRPHKARVLFVEPIINENQLLDLVKEVKSELRKIGIDVKKRTYIPHLTTARIKYGKDRKKMANLWLDQSFSLSPFIVDNILLYESTLTPNGPVYDVLETFEN